MKIPVTITIMIEIPDSVVKHFNEPVNNTPVKKEVVQKQVAFNRGPVAPENQRFGGISVTPPIAQVLKYVLEQGKALAVAKDGMKHHTFGRATSAGLLTQKKIIAKNAKGIETLRAEYELTDLGLDALAWFERKYG